MSDLEVSFLAIEIHNWLARFANGICDKTSTECVRYELIVRNSLHLMQQNLAIRRRFAKDQEVIESTADIPNNSYSTHRSKRWVFTGFLSAVTGLAGEEEIEKLKTVEENLRHVELDNAGEIVKLESKSNEFVSRISKQNERIVQLYKDESVLNKKLSDLLSEDASISKQLTTLVRSLETISDVNIEYAVVASIIELVPVLLGECRTMVHSLYDGILPNEVFQEMWKVSKISRETTRHIHSEVWIQHDLTSIVYYVPDYTEYTVIHIAFLPLRVGQNGACVRIRKDPYVAAVGFDSQFFDYGINECVTDADSSFCSPDRITVRIRPMTCVERLAVGNFRQLPGQCLRELKLTICDRQEFFRVSDKTYIYSLGNDTAIMECAGTQKRLLLGPGTSVFNATGCTISTSELIIFGIGKVKQDIFMSSSNIISAVSGLESVLDDVAVSRTVSLDNQTAFLSSYLETSKAETVDLEKATKELNKFKTIELLSNYTLFNFDMDLPLGMSNAVTGAYMGLAFLMFLVSFLCCCTCKCFRSTVFQCLKGLGKIIFDLIVYFCSYFWKICSGGNSGDSAGQMEGTAETELSTTVCATPVVSESGELATVKQTRAKRGSRSLFGQVGASPDLRQCSDSISPARSDRTFDPDKPPTPQLRKGSLGLSSGQAVDAEHNLADWDAEAGRDSGLESPKFHSTPVRINSLGRIMGQASGEFAQKRQVGNYWFWSIDYGRLLSRADMLKDDLASPWRIECYSNGSIKCVVGASCEELEFVRDPVSFSDKIVNVSGLEVSVSRPELFVVNKYSNMQQELDRNPVAVRDSDGRDCEVFLEGIWIPIYYEDGGWRLQWEFYECRRTDLHL
jgi:hypothetical protein